MKIRRDNREQTLTVKVDSMTAARAFGSSNVFRGTAPAIDLRNRLDNFRINIPRIQMTMSYTRAGIRVDDMTPQLRTFFGVNSNDGVLVASVDQSSAADKAGLRAGDVIIAVDNQRVRTPAEFDREMRSGSGKVSLRMVREKKEIDISVDRSLDSR